MLASASCLFFIKQVLALISRLCRYNKVMDSDGKFKKSAYLGTAYLVDVARKEVVTTGQGRFDTTALNLETVFQHSAMGEYKNLMVIIETQDGYFSPLIRFSQTFMLMGQVTSAYDMRMCLHWPSSKNIDYFLDEFDSISIAIKAKHEPTSWSYNETADKNIASEEVTIKSVRKELDKTAYKNFTVTANSGFSVSHSHDRVDDESIIRKRIRFKLTSDTEYSFTYKDLLGTLRAFHMYWIVVHDLIDCEITSIKLGNDITLVLADAKLSVVARNVEGYHSAVSIDTPLGLSHLAKLVHFYINSDSIKTLGSSSKIGLALNRLIGRRFEPKHKRLDYEVADLVFALQSFCEAIAQKEISRQNRADKANTLADITRVLKVIESIETDLSPNVRDFYTKDAGDIYTAISRPTFKRSLTITAEKLDVDLKPYDKVLSDIERARQQVVHSENYDPVFLVDLLTHGTTKTEKSEDGKTISMAIGIRKGSLDHLYDLLVLLIRKYLESYAS